MSLRLSVGRGGIDATVVLLLLLPASLRLAGERLWYLPSWLEWLPGEGAMEHVGRPKPKPTTP
jgi:putative drug exporter of the RND superfamily